MNDYHCLNCERRNKKKARRRRMIEKIYKNKYMVVCDNCEDGIELDTWDECMEFMRDNDWKRKLVDGKYNNYCPECQEG